MLPSEVRCREGAVCRARDKDTVCLSLPARLGAAAVEGAVGRLMIQKPLVGKCAPGRVWSLLVSGSAWQKLRISGRLMPISFSNKSCVHTVQQIAVLLQGKREKETLCWICSNVSGRLMPTSFSIRSCVRRVRQVDFSYSSQLQQPERSTETHPWEVHCTHCLCRRDKDHRPKQGKHCCMVCYTMKLL